MASSYPGSVSAAQVGSYFVGQYYQVLRQQPDLVHQFYSDSSSMIRVDGDYSETASDVLHIHNIVTSLNFSTIEIKTINSLDSWDGGVIVMVTGVVKIKDVNRKQKFVQTFFLAPQEKGYFVLNDIFQFVHEEVVHPNLVPVTSEKIDSQPHVSASFAEPPDYGFEEEAREYSVAQTIRETPVAHVEESYEEPAKKTYASILRVAKGQSVVSAAPQHAPQHSFKSAPPPSDFNHVTQPAVQQSVVQPAFQQSRSASTYVSESGAEATEESYKFEEEEVTSVYVRNLPGDITEAEIEEEFKNFGRIKPDGIFVRVRQEIGVCYAFVEFEDVVGVQNALQASPIQLAGRQIYIEERRPSSGGAARGGRGRGRGRGGYPTDAPRGRFGGRSSGRGYYQDTSDYTRSSGRGDGYLQRGSR
ncbi:nuclear transport factor 2 isoform X4 [Trifolium pratense]|uniref:nuclear transport factor 2 isoform X4 n=1 Tax=Trifolium pratense TaxID=57577 RepID=UPI001E6924F7|nr:nuclear transport factor 2 isoform X4 [Trifolium pratense]